MKDGFNIEMVSAMHDIQKAIETIEGITMKDHKIRVMVDELKSTRRELAYRVFRG